MIIETFKEFFASTLIVLIVIVIVPFFAMRVAWDWMRDKLIGCKPPPKPKPLVKRETTDEPPKCPKCGSERYRAFCAVCGEIQPGIYTDLHLAKDGMWNRVHGTLPDGTEINEGWRRK